MLSNELEQAAIERSRTDGEEAILLGRVLRIGVIIAGAFVLIGLALYLFGGHGGPASLDAALGKDSEVQRVHPKQIIEGLRDGSSGAFILTGLLVLILTPTIRVFMTMVFFVKHKEWIFVVLAGIVVVLLIIGLLGIA